MRSNTTEAAFEATIEASLINDNGYLQGSTRDFDPKYALDTRYLWEFLENTQADELAKLQKANPTDWKLKFYERFDRTIKLQGIISLLKNGLRLDDLDFVLMYPLPLASSSEKIQENFAKNIFSVTRQVNYSLKNPLEEIDVVLFLNGIALVTLELKNGATGQTARYHGQNQYKNDRDASEALLSHARAVVHMTLDTDEVYMTTKLAGNKTYFLPFNKGHNNGQGNPPNPKGHRTAYLWEEIFTKESLANIVQHFIRLDGKLTDPLSKRTLFFPRYHQLDVVRKIIDDVEHRGVGETYLIMHSAGSGKSNSITWAAYQLIEAYPLTEKAANGRSMEQPIFDSVIVVTDRRLLDRQIRDNIRTFSEVGNIIAPAHTSKELKQALETGKKIIITTIQKFPFIIDGIEDLSDKRFAVIIDEAHSSQSGSAHDNMNRAMGKNQEAARNGDADEDEFQDAQDKILELIQSRKMRQNASYLAFTATPKNSTLEKFGEAQADGSFIPFHLYSMKQAIEEGFILDVLANYSTYRSYYELTKSIKDNPKFNTVKAQKRLKAFVESNPDSITAKAEEIIKHFNETFVNTKKMHGKSKGMVITQSIESAIRYYLAIKRILEAKKAPYKALVAFSGEKEVDGIAYTESEINGFSDNDTALKFEEDEYRLLVVANKYLTGFDQPKLAAMYIDKKLSGVLCVQALSRLNRSAPKLGKRTEDLAILDFFNSAEEIQASFEPFYTATKLTEATDVNVLHDLKEMLDETMVYEQYEIEDFIKLYFNNADAMELSPILDIAADRFNQALDLTHEEKVDFKIKAKQFVKIYGQMAAIMPYEMVEWEKLFWFLKFLIPKLIVKDPSVDGIDALLESVDLSTYALERVKLNTAISLSDEESEINPQNPNPRGAHDMEEKYDVLTEIVRIFNEKWFQDWAATPEEQRVKIVTLRESIMNHPDYKEKYMATKDPHHRDLIFAKMIEEIMLRNRQTEMELYKLYKTDPTFKDAWLANMQRAVDSSEAS